MTKYRGPGAAARRLRIGVGAFVAATALLSLATSLPFWDALGIGLFYVLLPALGWAQLPLLPLTTIERIAVYAGSAATLIVIGCAAFVLGFASRSATSGSFPPLGDLPPGTFAVWTLGLIVVGVGVIVAFEPLDRRRPGPGSALVAELLPRTGREKGAFVGLSIVAGVAEEIAYRGYALSVLALLAFGPWLSAALSTLPFSLLHSYQGPIGIARTAVVGFALAASVVVSGSILPAMLAHAGIGVLAGLVVGPWLLAKAERGR